MIKERKYILDTTKAIERWNNSNQDKRQKNQSLLAKELGISAQSLVYWKQGDKKTPKWIERAIKLVNIVPSKISDIVKIEDGKYSIDYEKIKNDYNTKYFDRTQITIGHILKVSESSKDNKNDASWVKILVSICIVLECEPNEIIFEI